MHTPWPTLPRILNLSHAQYALVITGAYYKYAWERFSMWSILISIDLYIPSISTCTHPHIHTSIRALHIDLVHWALPSAHTRLQWFYRILKSHSITYWKKIITRFHCLLRKTLSQFSWRQSHLRHTRQFPALRASVAWLYIIHRYHDQWMCCTRIRTGAYIIYDQWSGRITTEFTNELMFVSLLFAALKSSWLCV